MSAVAEQTTTFALAEKSKLIKSLRRFDMVFFTICAFVGLDTLGSVAKNGPQGFLWLVILAVVFVAVIHTMLRFLKQRSGQSVPVFVRRRVAALSSPLVKEQAGQ